MQIKEMTDKSLWEDFLAECEEKTFFQSWNWGEFRKAVGEKIWRFGIYDKEQLVAVALASKKKAKRGTYVEVSHGPVTRDQIKEGRGEIIKILVETLKRIGRKENASFIRMNPLWGRGSENNVLFHDFGFREAPFYAAYESSWKLDVTPNEEELMRSMRKTTRYLIRQALKNSDIEVRQSLEPKDREQFHSLSYAVGERQKFVPFLKEDTEQEIKAFQDDREVSLFFGIYKGKTVAAALVIFWSGIAFYHQGASLGEYAKHSVPYLIQWEVIKEAKRRGCKLYDFWGFTDPKKYPKHPWAGPTLFKMGFGGKPYEYVKTQDYVLSWKYWPTAVFETIRTKRRHL